MPGISHYLRSIINTVVGRAPQGYSGAVDYHAGYRARVVAQSGDLRTVDVITDSELFPRTGMQAIPVRWGMPGLDASLTPGAFVTLLHDEGDPSKPYVTSCDPWSAQKATSIQIGGGSLPVARLGDLVSVTVDPITLGAALLACICPPGGGPLVPSPALALSPVRGVGVISTAATITKAG